MKKFLLRLCGFVVLILFLWLMAELFLWALDAELGMQEDAIKDYLDNLGR